MSSLPHASGVYCITCTPTGKVYIGSSFDIALRWNQHSKALARNAHKNRHFQSAWNKYGADVFECTVLALVLPHCLTEIEQRYIDATKSYLPAHGFNLNRDARSRLGSKHAPEAIRKMSVSSTGIRHTAETRAKMSEQRRGRKYSERERQGRIRDLLSRPNHGITPQMRAGQFAREAGDWILTTPTGDELHIKGLKTFCRENGLDDRTMFRVAKGEKVHHKGWLCRRA